MTALHNLQIVQPGEQRTRAMRAPSFPIAGGMKPMGLYPTFFTQVLPGETLDGATLKSTVVSSPLKSPLAGAWYEHWLFYVRLTDIDPALAEMFVGTLTDSAPYLAGVNRPRYFTKAGQVDWCYKATQVVMKHFFLDEDEPAVSHPDGVFQVKRINTDAFESTVAAQTAATTGAIGGDPEGVEISAQMMAFLKMNSMGMGFTSYDDYLKTFGLQPEEVTVATQQKPELLAYRRHWTLPTNVVDPADGSARGAWYWRIEDEATKAKRFIEPGFIIGFQAVRPKLLDSKYLWPVASSVWGFQDFIPSYTLGDPAAGIREVQINQQPWISQSEATAAKVAFDHRDLLSHGEQFVNGGQRYTVPMSSGRTWSAAATAAQLRGEYIATADVDALYVTAGGNVEYDGIASLRIKGHIRDATRS